MSNAPRHIIEERIKKIFKTSDINQKQAEIEAIEDQIYKYNMAVIYFETYESMTLDKISSFNYDAKAEYYNLKQLKICLRSREIKEKASINIEVIVTDLIERNRDQSENIERQIDTSPLNDLIETFRKYTVHNPKQLNEEVEILLDIIRRERSKPIVKRAIGRPKGNKSELNKSSNQRKITDLFKQN